MPKDFSPDDFHQYYTGTFVSLEGRIFYINGPGGNGRNANLISVAYLEHGADRDIRFSRSAKIEVKNLNDLLNWKVLKHPELGWRKLPNVPTAVPVFVTRRQDGFKKALTLRGIGIASPKCYTDVGAKVCLTSTTPGMRGEVSAEFIDQLFNPKFEKFKRAVEKIYDGESLGEVISPDIAISPSYDVNYPLQVYVGYNGINRYSRTKGWEDKNPEFIPPQLMKV